MTKALFDHHMHSEFSADSTQNYEELVQEAIQLGKKALVTTEHYEPINEANGFFCMDIEKYQQQIETMQMKYSKIRLLKGIEIGYEGSKKQRIQALIDNENFDIVIISIHTLFGGNDIAGTYKKYRYWPFGDDPVEQYFQAAIEAVEQLNNFQIFGHLDYVLRYVNHQQFTVKKYEAQLTRFFNSLISKNIALDLNTSGWSYGLGYAHPHPEILKLYKSLGGVLICLGSDAHQKQDMNREFEQTLQLLKQLGFTTITTYETGKMEQITIEQVLKN
ncbi:MAG: histidinol-phosphatase HisJ family protein [Culicoidibacterales bacterium]